MADVKSPMPSFSLPNLKRDQASTFPNGNYSKDQQTQGTSSIPGEHGTGAANPRTQSHKGKG